jgi:hypothetical protein
MPGEKRSFARLALHARTYILWDGQHIVGELENVSINGAFVMAASPMRVNEVVAFTIEDTPTIDRKAMVVRVTDKGMGLQFEKPLLD